MGGGNTRRAVIELVRALSGKKDFKKKKKIHTSITDLYRPVNIPRGKVIDTKRRK